MSRKSLTPTSSGTPTGIDPNSLSVVGLKKILAENRVDLPSTQQKKQYYVDLYNEKIAKSPVAGNTADISPVKRNLSSILAEASASKKSRNSTAGEEEPSRTVITKRKSIVLPVLYDPDAEENNNSNSNNDAISAAAVAAHQEPVKKSPIKRTRSKEIQVQEQEQDATPTQRRISRRTTSSGDTLAAVGTTTPKATKASSKKAAPLPAPIQQIYYPALTDAAPAIANVSPAVLSPPMTKISPHNSPPPPYYPKQYVSPPPLSAPTSSIPSLASTIAPTEIAPQPVAESTKAAFDIKRVLIVSGVVLLFGILIVFLDIDSIDIETVKTCVSIAVACLVLVGVASVIMKKSKENQIKQQALVEQLLSTAKAYLIQQSREYPPNIPADELRDHLLPSSKHKTSAKTQLWDQIQKKLYQDQQFKRKTVKIEGVQRDVWSYENPSNPQLLSSASPSVSTTFLKLPPAYYGSSSSLYPRF